MESEIAKRSDLEKIVPLPSEILDGRDVRLWANIGSLPDIEYAFHCKILF